MRGAADALEDDVAVAVAEADAVTDADADGEVVGVGLGLGDGGRKTDTAPTVRFVAEWYPTPRLPVIRIPCATTTPVSPVTLYGTSTASPVTAPRDSVA
jgi:hypothetical protein